MSGKRRSNERRPDLMYEKSFSERGRISQKNREAILRARIMLAVTVAALAIIVILLIVKLVSVGKRFIYVDNIISLKALIKSSHAM